MHIYIYIYTHTYIYIFNFNVGKTIIKHPPGITKWMVARLGEVATNARHPRAGAAFFHGF
jgi:hypothetical protein